MTPQEMQEMQQMQQQLIGAQQRVIQLMQNKSENTSQKVPPGNLVQYYNDIASGVLAPEDMRIENLQFRVQIDPAGNITFNTDAITLVSRYMFVFRRVSGFILDPDFAGMAPGLVNFQVRENGRNFEIFKRPVSMQALLTRNGNNVMEWDGIYTTVPGTDMSVEWTVDTQRWPLLVGVTKELGVQLLGDYVACAPR